MLMLLGSLAHNVIIWARHWLAVAPLQHYGILRMVRDVLHISGFLVFDAGFHLLHQGDRNGCPTAAYGEEGREIM